MFEVIKNIAVSPYMYLFLIFLPVLTIGLSSETSLKSSSDCRSGAGFVSPWLWSCRAPQATAEIQGLLKKLHVNVFLFLKLTRECRECKDRLMVKWLCVHLINMYLPQYIHDVIQISETATWVLKIIMQCWSQESERMAFFRCFASAGAAPAVY
jgi:hypothetical protein